MRASLLLLAVFLALMTGPELNAGEARPNMLIILANDLEQARHTLQSDYTGAMQSGVSFRALLTTGLTGRRSIRRPDMVATAPAASRYP